MRGYLTQLAVATGRNNHYFQTKKILQYLLQEGAKTIPEIKDFSNLSLPTTTKLINELLEQKILVETGKRGSSGGRPPVEYSLNPTQGYIVGIELLINSFRLSIINLVHELIYEYETDNFNLTNREEALQFLYRTVPDLLQKRGLGGSQILGVGIGITGRVSGRKGVSVSYLNFDTPLAKLLSDHWGYPVFIDNDTRLMTLGEQNFGVARQVQNAVYINLSRGLGIGLISNGNLHSGESGFAGEFGHTYFEDNDIKCVCGKVGCLETVVSGYALERNYRETFPQEASLHYRELLPKVYIGHKEVQQMVIQLGKRLGQALALLVQILNPSLIIIGGGFSEVGEQLKYPLMQSLHLFGLPQLVDDVSVETSSLGDKSTMLGAYALVMKNVFEETAM